MSGDLLDKADALMRRRSFVAGSGSANAGPEPSAAPLDDSAVEDLPVLTDIVDDEPAVIEAGTPSQLDIERAVRQRVEQLLMERQVLLAREIERWLDEQMPQLVIRAMDGITDHLVALLANRAKDELLPLVDGALKRAETTEPEADSAD